MGCENCPEPTTPIKPEVTEHCIMPRGFDLEPMLTNTGLTKEDIEKVTKDWVPCTWKLVIVKGKDVKAACIMRLDTSKCETCPDRHN